MFKKMAIEYFEESILLKNHIKKVKEEIYHQIQNKNPEAIWRINLLYQMYIDVRREAIYLKKRSLMYGE